MGATLIEVVISILILAIGVLGLAGLQLSSKRAGFEAVQRTTAAVLAQDILERMRGNAGSLALYDDKTLGGGTIGTEPAACTGNCTETAIANRDLWEWEQALDGEAELSPTDVAVGGLVNPTGCLDTDFGGTSGFVRISIAWEGYESLTYTPETADSCGNALGARRQLLSVETFISDQ